MATLLLRHATVLTMDDRLGDLPRADILIEGDRIAAVGPDLAATSIDAEVEDVTGCIVLPGLVNAHMHTWQTALRSLASDWTLPEYFRWVHAGLATKFTPDDIAISTLAGALNQLNCGTTTLVDWCHNNPTPDHTDAAVSALFDSGIRAAFFHGSPKPDAQPGQPNFWEVPHPRGEVERLLRGRLAASDGLVTLGLALLGPHYSTLDVALQDFRLAAELGLTASVHQGGGAPRTPGGWQRLMAEGLVGPHTNIVHGNDLTDDELGRFVSLGASFSACPENEMIQGHGWPVTGRLRRLHVAPSLGVDVESVVSGEMLTVARTALSLQRAIDNADARRDSGGIPDTTTIPARQALRWITIEGARMLGMDSRIGSITPGKQADLVVLRFDALNSAPFYNPAASVVMQTSLANVDSVLVAGTYRKRHGRLLVPDIAALQHRLHASGLRIAEALGLDTRFASA